MLSEALLEVTLTTTRRVVCSLPLSGLSRPPSRDGEHCNVEIAAGTFSPHLPIVGVS